MVEELHIDEVQIKRWKAFGDRHGPAKKKNCEELIKMQTKTKTSTIAMGL